MTVTCAEVVPDGGPAGAVERLGFSGPVLEVPAERLKSWCGEELERLAHGGERLGCELLLGWLPEAGAQRLKRWVVRLARASPLRRFVHLGVEPGGGLLLAMLPPGRFERRDVVVRRLDDATFEAVARLAAHGREHLALRLSDLLGREMLTRRFFGQFRRHLLALEAGWTGLPNGLADEAARRRDLAMTTLCRLMFLTFLARSGRLGPVDSAHWIVERPRVRSLYRDVLRPLFFGVLNTPAAERAPEAASLDLLPFLNGGLFEPLEIERLETLDVADELLLVAIDELFESYELTPREGDESSRPAIDPEMLGQVFEALMLADERRQSGTFYTPAHLVRTFVLDALSEWARLQRPAWGDWVRATLEGAAAPGLSESEATALDSALARVRVLDPAVGSGAFLLGTLEGLVALRSGLDGALGRRPDRCRLTRHAIAHCLYGVDRKIGAVRLCELRLWLSLVVEAPADRPLEPLPNLDHHIRQGDSLSGRGLPAPSDLLAGTDETNGLRYADVHGPDKERLGRQRRLSELARLKALIATERRALRAQKAAVERALQGEDLFGAPRRPDAAQRRALRDLADRLVELEAEERALVRGELPIFSFRAAFPEVFAESGGFPVVVGNPPWVRLHAIPATSRARIRRRFRCCRGLGTGFEAQVDLSAVFVERSLELSAPDGVVGLLLPAKLFRARYGRRLRAELLERHQLLHYADLSLARQRLFAASNYPAWLLVQNLPPRRGDRCRITLAGGDGAWESERRLPEAVPEGGDKTAPWSVVPDGALAALTAMRGGGVTVGEYGLTATLGLKTGRNRVFLTEDWTECEDGQVALTMADGALLRLPGELAPRAVRGRDLSAFGVRAPLRLVAAYDRRSMRPLKTLPPALQAYFESHAEPLSQRRDSGGRGAPWRLFRRRGLAPGPKVIWRDIAPRLEAVLCESEDLVPLNTAYFMVPADRHEGLVLAALLNSRWARIFTAVTAEPAMSGYFRFLAWTVSRLPWPARLRLGSRSARRLAHLSEAAHAEWSPGLQAAIDDRLAWAWGLERRHVSALEALARFYPEVLR